MSLFNERSCCGPKLVLSILARWPTAISQKYFIKKINLIFQIQTQVKIFRPISSQMAEIALQITVFWPPAQPALAQEKNQGHNVLPKLMSKKSQHLYSLHGWVKFSMSIFNKLLTCFAGKGITPLRKSVDTFQIR